MTLRFVKTSVLVSEDGLDFSKETAVESEEARAARLARESAANKPLYQQLADIKQRKQDEYDANTKLLFSAPKALDEDEYYFLESLKDSQASAERLNKEEEEKALEQFRIARKLQKEDGIVSQSQPKVVLKADKSNSSSLSLGSSSVSTVRVTKRKIADKNSDSHEQIGASEKRQKVASPYHTSNEDHKNSEKASMVAVADVGSGLDLLSGYGSDSSS